MVDWKTLYESWDELSPEIKKKLIDAFKAKPREKLKELFKKEPYAGWLYEKKLFLAIYTWEEVKKIWNELESLDKANGGWFEYLRTYVKEKMLQSGVFSNQESNPEDPTSMATHIVSDARRSGRNPFDEADSIIDRDVKARKEAPAPKFKVGDYVDVGPVYPPVRPGGGGLYESIVKVIDVIPQEPPSLDKYAYTVEDTHGQKMTFLESAIKPAIPPEKPTVPAGPRFKAGDKVVDRRTGDEYTIKNVDKWPSVLIEDRYGGLTAKDEFQLVTPEEYETLKKEERVAREERRAPVPVPGVPARKGLSDDDRKRLLDLYNDALFRALGKVPSSSAATFRVELEKVKDKTFEEAKDAILGVANEIIAALSIAKKIRVAPPVKPKEVPIPPPRELPGYGVRAPPAQFPSFPLSYEMPFPRGPTSKEREPLWRAFRYLMQEQGYDAFEYQRQFEEYIMETQFLSWEDMREKFELFLQTIMSGRQLPPLEYWRGMPIPTGLKGLIMEKPELEKLEDLIVHYSSVVIRNARSKGDVPTLEDLRKELLEHAVITADTSMEELRDAAKTAITRAIERKDAWMAGITATEVNDFLSS